MLSHNLGLTTLTRDKVLKKGQTHRCMYRELRSYDLGYLMEKLQYPGSSTCLL